MEQRLGEALQGQLGWEHDMVQAVVTSVKDATAQNATSEVEDLCKNMLGDDPVCRQAIEQYAEEALAAKVGGGMKLAKHKTSDADRFFDTAPQRKGTPQPAPQAAAPHDGQAAPAVASSAVASNGAAQQAPAATQTAAEQPASAAAQPALKPSALSVKTVVPSKKRGAKAGEGQAAAPRQALKKLERQVFNCLSCGKVYDCRTVTQDGLDLMTAQGLCVFCAEAIPVAVAACRAAGGSSAAQAQPDTRPQDPAAAASSSAAVPNAAGMPVDASAQRAHEYAARMVEYDRTASKRTAVIDDQGDYYEIDGNVWLTPEERAEVKQRQDIEAQVRQQRRDKMVVSVDLIGRTVISEDPDAEVGPTMFERTSDQEKAARAAAATRAEAPQGGGTAAAAAEAAASGAGLAGRVAGVRMAPCLPEGVDAPMFMTRAQREQLAKANGKQGGDKGSDAAVAKQSKPAKQKNKSKSQSNDQQAAKPEQRQAKQRPRLARVQNSMVSDAFDQFAADVDVMFGSVGEAERAVAAA